MLENSKQQLKVYLTKRTRADFLVNHFSIKAFSWTLNVLILTRYNRLKTMAITETLNGNCVSSTMYLPESEKTRISLTNGVKISKMYVIY